MTFADLKTELVARGAENDDDRAGFWINIAYRKIINAQDWPFTEIVTIGTSGAGLVAITDVRKIITVGDVSDGGSGPGRRLKRISFPELVEDLGVEDVGETGTPEYWWMASGSILAYPLGGTIFVRYHKRVPELTGVTEPIFDAEYHPLIVDRAMVEVYKDADEFAAAKEALNQYYIDLAEMTKDYQVFSREHGYIQVHDATDG